MITQIFKAKNEKNEWVFGNYYYIDIDKTHNIWDYKANIGYRIDQKTLCFKCNVDNWFENDILEFTIESSKISESVLKYDGINFSINGHIITQTFLNNLKERNINIKCNKNIYD